MKSIAATKKAKTEREDILDGKELFRLVKKHKKEKMVELKIK